MLRGSLHGPRSVNRQDKTKRYMARSYHNDLADLAAARYDRIARGNASPAQDDPTDHLDGSGEDQDRWEGSVTGCGLLSWLSLCLSVLGALSALVLVSCGLWLLACLGSLALWWSLGCLCVCSVCVLPVFACVCLCFLSVKKPSNNKRGVCLLVFACVSCR